MARPRKLWSQLAPGTRARKLSHYKRHGGLSPAKVARRYNAGTLGPQTAVRGHRGTPEHGLEEALKKPGTYPAYERRQAKPKPGETPHEYAIRTNTTLDAAHRSMSRLQHYVHYSGDTVRANVYGGETPESGPVPGMSLAQAAWTAQADLEEIRSMASEQYRGNPWWYH